MTRVLALGNTANVMPTVAKHLDNVSVVYGITHPILEINEKCWYDPDLRYPMTQSRISALRKLASRVDLFHAEIDYSVDCLHAGVKYGVQIHGIDALGTLFPKGVVASVLGRAYREAIRNAAYVAVSTQNLLPYLRKLRPDAFWVPNPVDLEEFKPRRSPVEGRPRLFCPGRMDAWKGHEVIWEALRILGRRDIEVLQVDWGWEPLYTVLRRSAPPCVRFIPLVPHNETANYYNNATVTLGQMKLGSPGMSELEAAACFCPVTCYCSWEQAPFLPKRGDAEELATLLTRLLDDADYRLEYAEECRDYVRTVHDAVEISNLWEEIWSNASKGAEPSERSSRWFAYSIIGETRRAMLRTLGERNLRAIEHLLLD